ncbi:hypothetical protein H6P81_007464 [Aristolochia fimbriata]|uniref:Uncharacterized protein n=1 Tax=Aristolochia fimbriata TaxID=158543 RepID=A0AAV7F0B1_ARIFI|nr:hypothetical protein H6P81_007464 [Aristolochia fimbriata]
MARQQVSAYEMLEKFNFPRGILPEGVRGYVLHDDGSFEVFLNGDCKFNVEGGYSLSYGKKITGKLSFGSLKDLQGVNVKVRRGTFLARIAGGLIPLKFEIVQSLDIYGHSKPLFVWIISSHTGAMAFNQISSSLREPETDGAKESAVVALIVYNYAYSYSTNLVGGFLKCGGWTA